MKQCAKCSGNVKDGDLHCRHCGAFCSEQSEAGSARQTEDVQAKAQPISDKKQFGEKSWFAACATVIGTIVLLAIALCLIVYFKSRTSDSAGIPGMSQLNGTSPVSSERPECADGEWLADAIGRRLVDSGRLSVQNWALLSVVFTNTSIDSALGGNEADKTFNNSLFGMKTMSAARQDFLSKGYSSESLDSVFKLISEHYSFNPNNEEDINSIRALTPLMAITHKEVCSLQSSSANTSVQQEQIEPTVQQAPTTDDSKQDQDSDDDTEQQSQSANTAASQSQLKPLDRVVAAAHTKADNDALASNLQSFFNVNLRGASIHVRVSDGTVTLTGVASSEAIRNQAVQDAQHYLAAQHRLDAITNNVTVSIQQ